MKVTKKIISVVGPTGIGKTKLSIALAQHLHTEILSCDSRQFFAEMPIGTAAPTAPELAKVPHHFIGNLSVKDDYSIGQYEKEALAKTQKLFETYDTLVVVGGSGMYEKALLEGLNDLPESNEANVSQLNNLYENRGIEALQSLLKDLDFEYYSQIDVQNPRRLIRAIDVIWQTNTPFSTLILASKNQRNFSHIRVGIDAPREIIYDRINHRVDAMIENGLLDEVKSLICFREKTALKTVAYTEIFQYLDGILNWEDCVEEIKKNSRRFAKRQLTWYRKDSKIIWMNYNSPWEELKKTLSLYLN